MLLDLASRCEAVTGPDRELDCRISEAVGRPWRSWPQAKRDPITSVMGEYVSVPDAALYSASLDAALTLVPEGCVWTVLTDYDLPGRARIYGWPLPHENAAPLLRQADAATPALALCAAALRSRAQQEGQR